ncbi:hypothetical protein ABZW11_42520 [Nonomuraea sp. NPDC004580]|uniref:hypothetical protein n=1 Tax=Nonomuraea sp. NPDC004580 TaxID=3154552 RepID=UPI0033AFD3A1
MQRVSRRISTIAGAGVLALLLAGCGGVDTSESVEKPKTAEKTQAAEKPASAGTPLTLDTAPRQVNYTDRDDKVHELTLNPTQLTRGSASDLDGVRLDDDMRGMVPHYLTVSITNAGTDAVEPSMPVRNFRVALADGTAGKAVSFFSGNPLASPGTGPLETCIGTTAPKSLTAGQAATECRVVLLPEDAKPATVSYSDESVTRTWKVEGGDVGGGVGGGVLAAGKPAKVTWKDTDDQDVPLTVTLKSVRRAGAGALADYKLNARQKAASVYFVTLAYRNNGKSKLYPGMDEAVILRTESGQTLRKLTLIAIGSNGPKGCPSSRPYGMVQPGKSVQQCGVYLVDKGDKPVTVTFSSTAEGAEPVTWKAS